MAIHSDWTVMPHGPIERLTDNLWRVRGELGRMPIGRVMTLARRADGTVVIHNAIALEEPLMAEIEAWGRPSAILVPSRFHRLDAPAFAARYPDARVYCPARARAKVAQVVRVDGDYADFPPDRDVSLGHLDGTRDREGVLEVRSADGTTAVVNDILFNLPRLGGPLGLALRVDGAVGRLRVPRSSRLLLVASRSALRAHLEQLARPDLRRVIVSHGDVVSEESAAALCSAAAEL
jgi:hypothetical protein